MSGNETEDRNQQDREGPQGTRVFSQSEVDQLLADAATPNDAGKQPSLRGVTAPIAGQRFLLSDYRLVLGRANSCDIVIEEPSVSSEHARISRDDEGWRVANLLSTNGTFVNDSRVRAARLRDGDRVRLGRVEMIFEHPGEPSGGRTGTSGSGNDSVKWIIAGAVVAVAVVAALLLL